MDYLIANNIIIELKLVEPLKRLLMYMSKKVVQRYRMLLNAYNLTKSSFSFLVLFVFV